MSPSATVSTAPTPTAPIPTALPANALPPGVRVFERGWLSSNNVLIDGPEGATLVDSGYASHAAQTVALVEQALQGRPLCQLLNTHLHSDHCGGNAALQARFAGVQTWIPPGQAEAARAWDEAALSFRATGQRCPRFAFDALLQPGQALALGGHAWQIHAAPGHDPHAVLLFEPQRRLLISGDALWPNGFGVVFPELDGEPGFAEVAATLDAIEALQPLLVIPGHGALIAGAPAVALALERARSRLAQFATQPERHREYAIKVLLKFRLIEWQSAALSDFLAWAEGTPYLQHLHRRHGAGQHLRPWVQQRIDELVRSQAARLELGPDGPRLFDA